MGQLRQIAAEFQKLDQSIWPPVKVVIGLGVVGAVLASILFVRIDRRASFLLASHVFTVTLGYGSVLLTGMLGICFVCQRCLFDFLRNAPAIPLAH